MRRIIFAALIVALAACSKDKDVDAPAKLANIQATLQVARVWSADVGGQKVPLRLGLALAVGVLVDVQNTLCINALLRWGTPEQKKAFLPRLATDTVGAYALS